jgi:hypothetical protein
MPFLGRDIRSRIDLTQERAEKKTTEKSIEGKKFEIGDKVAVRFYGSRVNKWEFGEVVGEEGCYLYRVKVDGRLHRRRVDQQRRVSEHLT